jgi:two-component system NtrC family sensor kinase
MTMTSSNSHIARVASWQALEDFNDQMAEAVTLESASEMALAYVLETVERSGGVLIIQTARDENPVWIAAGGIPSEWRAQVEDVYSPLRRLARDLTRPNANSDPAQSLPDLAAALPLLSLSGPQGAVLIYGQPCDLAELDLLTRLARLLGRSLRALRMRQTADRHTQELAALHLMVTTLGYHSDFDSMQAQIVRGICRILDCTSGALVLVDGDQPGVLTRKWLSPDDEWFYEVDLAPGDGLLWDCLNNGRGFWLNDASADPRFNPSLDSVDGLAQAEPGGLAAHSLLYVPLEMDGRPLGAIQVFDKRSGPFSAADQQLVTMIANLAAQSIYGRQLIQQLKVANADLEASHWELLRSRNTLRALFDSMPAALYIIDRKYRLMAINLACAGRTGQPPKALVGRQCHEALYGRSEPCPGCRVSETLLSGESTNRSDRRWGAGEDPTEFEISSYPILDEGDQVVQAILLEQDVTEKRRLESIIAQSEKLAAVGQLAAGVAHEINNPLTAIIANAQLLQRELPPDPEIQESLDLIVRAGARATQVVRNLLDFARKEQYNLAPTDINETMQRALALVQHELIARSILLDFQPGKNLPRILASNDHLQGVWLNLLLNAVDAIGSVESNQGKLTVTTRRISNEVRVSVADTGKGIPLERLNRIFEPFYTTKAPGRGTGLGLSVCHRVIKQHGGHILVNSTIGKGTEFTVVLPIGK